MAYSSLFARLGLGIASIGLVHVFLMPVPVSAAPAGGYGLEQTANVAFQDSPELKKKIELTTLIARLIGFGLSFLGIIFLGIVIYGGFLWMTAGGSDDKVGKAIHMVTNAGIGLMIILAAYLLTRYIGNAFITILS